MFTAVANILVQPLFINLTQPQQNFEGAFLEIKDFEIDQSEHHYILPINLSSALFSYIRTSLDVTYYSI